MYYCCCYRVASKLCPPLCDTWTVSMGFPRQKYRTFFLFCQYWVLATKTGLPFPSPGNIPGPGIKTVSSAGGFFITEPPGKNV